METSVDFEGGPAKDPYREVFSTWRQVDDTFRKFFAKEAEIEDINESLNTHAETLEPFIIKYLEETGLPEETAIINLHRILIPLHQEPFQANIEANNLDQSKFKLFDVDDVIERADKLLAIVEAVRSDGNEVDIPGSMQTEFSIILELNTRALVDPIAAKRLDQQERIEQIKYHALEMGETAIGVTIGLSAFGLLQRAGRIKSRNRFS